jgi:hypothetical protein
MTIQSSFLGFRSIGPCSWFKAGGSRQKQATGTVENVLKSAVEGLEVEGPGLGHIIVDLVSVLWLCAISSCRPICATPENCSQPTAEH